LRKISPLVGDIRPASGAVAPCSSIGGKSPWAKRKNIAKKGVPARQIIPEAINKKRSPPKARAAKKKKDFLPEVLRRTGESMGDEPCRNDEGEREE